MILTQHSKDIYIYKQDSRGSESCSFKLGSSDMWRNILRLDIDFRRMLLLPSSQWISHKLLCWKCF